MLGSKPPPKGRRTSGGAGEQVKHRRTRSGCFTCRQRRVKCDEARPICERCQKGNRACVYPEPTAPSSSRSGGSGSKKASAPEPASSGDDLDDLDEDVGLSTIVDEPEGDDPRVEHSGGQHQKKSVDSGKSKNVGQWKSRDDSAGQDKGSSPSTEASTPFSSAYSGSGHRATSSSDPSEPSPSIPDWSRLPADLQFYLDYHQSQLTHHHYFFKTNSDRFLRTVFLDQALRSEPLLYAVVGFAAYHHTLTRPDGKLQHFLKYYNKSITLLRLSLGKRVHSLANLLTILELATLEEYLGDWVNLLGHQKAAFELLTSLFTPQTIMESETRRIILAWYARFDVFAGLMAGHETVLGRDWFQSNQQHASELVRRNPEDVDLKYDEFFSKVRLTAMDMSILFARLKKGEIDPQTFIEQNNILTQRISDLRFAMDSVLFDQTYLIKDMSYAGMGDPEDIVDPYVPGLLFGGQLWTTNFLLLDWYSLDLMHTYQTSLALQMPPPPKLTELALKICQMFEAIQLFPESQGGGVLGAQAPVAIATLFLPKDYRHTMWCRRKFALVESLGYIYPITFRQKMSEVWGLPEVIHWWLPNNEGYPEIVRSMRQFVEDRITAPKDQAGEDLRDIKNIFRDMSLGDSPNKSSSGSPGDSMGSSLPDMQPGSFSAPSMSGEQSQSFDELLMHGEVPAYWDFTQSSTNNNPYGSHGPP